VCTSLVRKGSKMQQYSIAAADKTGRVEVAVNGMPQAWDDRNFVVGQGQGLFQHNDLEKEPHLQSPCPKWW
jgi:hypothetical protein